MLQINILNFGASLHELLQLLFLFLLEKLFIILRINFADILITIHILFRFIKTQLKSVAEIIEYPLILEVYQRHLLHFYYFLDLLYRLSISFTIKYF